MSVLLLLAVVLVLRKQGAERPEVPVVSYLAASLGPVVLMISLILAPSLDSQARKAAATQDRDQIDLHLARGLVSKNIMLVALLEGAAIANLIVFMLEDRLLCLAVGGAVLLAMAAHFPTMDHAARWIERQKQLIQDAFEQGVQ
ncbi:MAG: hypothetical protein MI923_29885 [Phycisphaerales bacterium]|nr:hypothetical protein [Phycisphaerales bacterium]